MTVPGCIRIRAKAPKSPEPENGIRTYYMAGWCDMEIFVVNEDGTETPFTGVKSVHFVAAEHFTSPLTATLEVYVDEIDIEAEAK